MTDDANHRNASGDHARHGTRTDEESRTEAKLGWTDPPAVPDRPGEGLQWEVVDADGTDVLVARSPDESGAWVSMVRAGGSSEAGRVVEE